MRPPIPPTAGEITAYARRSRIGRDKAARELWRSWAHRYADTIARSTAQGVTISHIVALCEIIDAIISQLGELDDA